MGVWDLYQRRLDVHGSTKRDAVRKRELRMLSSMLSDSLSYHSVVLNNESVDVAIINTDNLNTKFIYSMPGEDIANGSIVEWMGNHWLVIERDANNELYTKAKMLQCNYLLKWIDEDGIHEQWCIIEDGTKYLTGELEDRTFTVVRGDSRIAMTIARNDKTLKFSREYRFIIDDPESTEKLTYALTKPLKTGKVYGGDGVFSFVLQEVASTDDDNFELGVADYYKHFPANKQPDGYDDAVIKPDNVNDSGKKVWL